MVGTLITYVAYLLTLLLGITNQTQFYSFFYTTANFLMVVIKRKFLQRQSILIIIHLTSTFSLGNKCHFDLELQLQKSLTAVPTDAQSHYLSAALKIRKIVRALLYSVFCKYIALW